MLSLESSFPGGPPSASSESSLAMGTRFSVERCFLGRPTVGWWWWEETDGASTGISGRSSVSVLARRRLWVRPVVDMVGDSSSSSSVTLFPRRRDLESPERDVGGEPVSSILVSSSPPVVDVAVANIEE